MTEIATRYIIQRGPDTEDEVVDTTLPVRLHVGDVISLDIEDAAEDDFSNGFSVRGASAALSADWGFVGMNYFLIPLDYVDEWEAAELEKRRAAATH